LLALLEHAADPEVIRAATLIAARFSWQSHFRKLEDLLVKVACARRGDRANVA
jgi:hypothetical protein